jgi:hypothetical protein
MFNGPRSFTLTVSHLATRDVDLAPSPIHHRLAAAGP